MAKGDHIFVKCRSGMIPFHHHGIDAGDGTVIHLVGIGGRRVALGDRDDFCVRRDSMEDFASGEPVHTVTYGDEARSPDQIVASAEGMVGTANYNLLDNNCEHFATHCVTGKGTSPQIERSEATVQAVVSAATKTASVLSARVAAKLAIRGAAKLHPAALLADGVEIAVLTSSCNARVSPERSKQLARVSGSLTAAGVGAVVGGPVGAAAFLAAHTTSTAIAERTVGFARRYLSRPPIAQ
ncbi:MAG: hypothetical protein Aurels2KO_41470 [Aureliella sp.]